VFAVERLLFPAVAYLTKHCLPLPSPPSKAEDSNPSLGCASTVFHRRILLPSAAIRPGASTAVAWATVPFGARVSEVSAMRSRPSFLSPFKGSLFPDCFGRRSYQRQWLHHPLSLLLRWRRWLVTLKTQVKMWARLLATRSRVIGDGHAREGPPPGGSRSSSQSRRRAGPVSRSRAFLPCLISLPPDLGASSIVRPKS
jgi:hypothetical protein